MTNVQEKIQELLGDKPKNFIYMDNAATTSLDPVVKEAMEPFLTSCFGNPGAFYEIGRSAKIAVDEARKNVASILNCTPREIIFTGSGTESDNMAIFGIARKHAEKGRHIITSCIEHHAVEMPCKQLVKEGFEVTYLPVDKYGAVSVDDVKAALRDDTILVSVMYANNEIGTIQPIKEIAELLKDHQAFFHTDACQAAGALSLDVQELGVDAMTLNGSKIYGPKGVGILYLKRGVRIQPLIFGGGQERGLRGGTENVAYIVGFAKALEIADGMREEESARLIELRDRLINGLMKSITKTILNGHPSKRLPNSANVSILDIEGEAFTLFLNELGIYASTGSACTSESLDPSHVIIATGLPYECAHGSMRFTLGRSTTEEDVDYVLSVVPAIVDILRKMSPLNLDESMVREEGKGELHYI
ncbi:cysteine desulfurase NifS [Candidatus Peregrinibacteria bacterium]|jgi:cysteine desulfurase|nr:cysteine desulfurase NifS [Candidatus Peregrinibacteria bacterium]MBT5517184.1 cysteine desulfurase NifS [Candidatus Peregrinibacteria bacterium]MBT5823766.1 cysteine desulfurase NifS [Candidatus Peregrinibacteria bacterium]